MTSPEKYCHLLEDKVTKLTDISDPGAWRRGPGSAVLQRELERERRPKPFRGPGNVEMGAEDGVLLPLLCSRALPPPALQLRVLPPRTRAWQVQFFLQLMCRPEETKALSFANVARPRMLE